MYPNLTETLLETLPVPALALDDQGNILYFNEAARRLLPTSAQTGSRIDTVLPDSAVLLTLMTAHPEGFQCEVTWGDLANSPTVVEAHVVPMPAIGWAVALLDISALKAEEVARNNLFNEVVHDLKQPLSAISSFVDVLKATGELNERQMQFLDRIRTLATRMADQVHQMLDMAWIDTGMKLTLVEVDLVTLTTNLLDDLATRASLKQIRLVLDAAPVPAVIGDSNRLTEVISNLVTNAIKYSKDDSTVTVKITPQAEVVALSVTDEGIGIAREHLPRLFQRFYRVQDKQTRRVEGSGLGLYIARSIVEKHGGHISVQSEPGIGSTFTVLLPIPSADLKKSITSLNGETQGSTS